MLLQKFGRVSRLCLQWSVGLFATVAALLLPAAVLASDDPFPYWPDDEIIASAVASTELGGYTSKVSVAQGETLDFHLSSNVNTPFSIKIYREGTPRTLMMTVSNVSAQAHSCDGGYATGCNWPVAYTLTVPASWPSGVYTADIPVQTNSTQKLIFWVREDQPGSTAPLLYLSSVNTFQAYNNYGGKSTYAFNSTDGEPSITVSFNRPYVQGGVGKYARWESKFVNWIDQQPYSVEYATTYDLEFIPNLLDAYQTVVLAGHSEYWTWDARQRLKDFIARGGRLVNLSGNTMWWQIRYQDDGRTLVAYKKYTADPVKTAQGVTDNPYKHPIYDPPAAIVGAHWPFGGYPLSAPFSFNAGYGGYFVQNSDHWIFADVNISDGAMLGRTDSTATAVLGHEVDGVPFNCTPDGQTIIGPIANTGAPGNFTILGVSPVSYKRLGFAVMGIYTNPAGGGVFSVNSTDWVNALGSDAQVTTLMHNVLRRFGDPAPLPAEPPNPTAHRLFVDSFNCDHLYRNWPQSNAPNWAQLPAYNYIKWTIEDAFQLSDACGVEGGGLAITMKRVSGQNLTAPVKADWRLIDAWHGQIYLNLGSLTVANGSSVELIRFSRDDGVTFSPLVALQVRRQAGAMQVGLAPTGEDGVWLPAPASGPFLVGWAWDRATGRIALTVNDEEQEGTVASPAQAGGNRVDLGLMRVGSGISGSVCVDEFVFHDQPLTAQPPQLHSLTVTVIGEGVVTRDPDLVSYPAGAQVMLTASPNAGWSFDGWQGAIANAANPVTVVVDGDMAVVATFVEDAPPPTPTPTVTATATPTGAPDNTPTPTPTATQVDSPDNTATPTATPTPTQAGAPDNTATPTPTPTATQVDSPDNTATPTPTPSPTPEQAGNEPVLLSDDFNGCALDGVRWQWVNPLGDGSYRLDGEQLIITAPGGVAHDIGAAGITTPRLIQPVRDRDFTIEVKFASRVTEAYQLQGVLIEQDAQNLVQIELHHDGVATNLAVITHANGQPTIRSQLAVASGAADHLRIRRMGDNWQVAHSVDGADWASEASFTHALQVKQVGPFAGNRAQGDSPPPPHHAIIDYLFDGDTPISSEDARPLRLRVVTNGAGEVALEPPCGNPVTLTAAAAPGWVFAGWQGAYVGAENPVTLHFNREDEVTARFTPLAIHKVQLTATEGGQVMVEPPGPLYAAGEVVTLTAVPADGWVFVYWEIDEGVDAASDRPTTPMLQLTMPDLRRFRAVFAPIGDGHQLYLPVVADPTR